MQTKNGSRSTYRVCICTTCIVQCTLCTGNIGAPPPVLTPVLPPVLPSLLPLLIPLLAPPLVCLPSILAGLLPRLPVTIVTSMWRPLAIAVTNRDGGSEGVGRDGMVGEDSMAVVAMEQRVAEAVDLEALGAAVGVAGGAAGVEAQGGGRQEGGGQGQGEGEEHGRHGQVQARH